MLFPTVRMQRYRQSPQIRQLMAETHLEKADLIMPVFINENLKDKLAIKEIPDNYQHSSESLIPYLESLVEKGLSSILLFGIPQEKDSLGTQAYNPKGIIQKSISRIKKEFPKLVVIADCCLCEYTSHGQCGVLKEGRLDNDKTVELLQKVALSYAEAGVDIIAPSGMMDGMIAEIRKSLDQSEFTMTSLLSYAVKYASSFYGPFRIAAGSKDTFRGDRMHHQLAPSQKREALREALLDVEEGADYLMVKPSLPYLDIVRTIKEKTLLPLSIYHVSGEYAMLKKAAKDGIVEEFEAFQEIFLSMKRAGADFIINYYTEEMLKRLGN